MLRSHTLLEGYDVGVKSIWGVVYWNTNHFLHLGRSLRGGEAGLVRGGVGKKVCCCWDWGISGPQKTGRNLGMVKNNHHLVPTLIFSSMLASCLSKDQLYEGPKTIPMCVNKPSSAYVLSESGFASEYLGVS